MLILFAYFGQLVGPVKDVFGRPKKIAEALSERAHTMKMIADGVRPVQGAQGQGKRKNTKFTAK